MIPNDDNPELTRFMVAMRFAGDVEWATLPKEERQERAGAMILQLATAFSAAVEIMAMDKGSVIERRAWDKPVSCETMAIATKLAEEVHKTIAAASARVLCAMAEYVDR
jgi:hypothetical protein